MLPATTSTPTDASASVAAIAFATATAIVGADYYNDNYAGILSIMLSSMPMPMLMSMATMVDGDDGW